jgi:hypothetical protein
MPRRRTAERGEGNLGCIFWVLLAAIGVLIAWKAVPVKMSSSELYDYMDEMARFSAGKEPPEEIKKKILARANELRLPLDKEHVSVERVGDSIRMSVEYTVPVEFPGYTYNWHFQHELNRPIFIV